MSGDFTNRWLPGSSYRPSAWESGWRPSVIFLTSTSSFSHQNWFYFFFFHTSSFDHLKVGHCSIWKTHRSSVQRGCEVRHFKLIQSESQHWEQKHKMCPRSSLTKQDTTWWFNRVDPGNCQYVISIELRIYIGLVIIRSHLRSYHHPSYSIH